MTSPASLWYHYQPSHSSSHVTMMSANFLWPPAPRPLLLSPDSNVSVGDLVNRWYYRDIMSSSRVVNFTSLINLVTWEAWCMWQYIYDVKVMWQDAMSLKRKWRQIIACDVMATWLYVTSGDRKCRYGTGNDVKKCRWRHFPSTTIIFPLLTLFFPVQMIGHSNCS